MSYEIVYGRQFIKVPMDGEIRYIPLSLHGSNNCTQLNYQTGKEIRERYWSAMYFNGAGMLPVLTEQQILDYIKANGSSYDQNFKRGGKWVDNAAMYRYFKNGIEQAKTLEEIFTTNKSGVRSLKLTITQNGGGRTERYISSTIELLQTITELQATLSKSVFYTFRFGIDEPIQFRPQPNQTPSTTIPLKELTEYFILKYKEHVGYVESITSTKLYSTRNTISAKRFRTEAEATKWVNQYMRKFKVEVTIEKVTSS